MLRGSRLDPGRDLVNIWTRQTSLANSEDYWPREDLDSLQRTLTEGVEIFGLFKAELGIGEAARRLVRAIRTTGYPTATHTISLPETFRQTIHFESDRVSTERFVTALLFFNGDTLVNLLRAKKIALPDIAGRRRIGFWHWELPIFPPIWAHTFDLVDEIWAPSRFAATSIAAATHKPVRIVPHAVVVPDIDTKQARGILSLDVDATIFLVIFDFNSRLARKNPLGAILAFQGAFTPERLDVRLVVKCHGQANFPDDFEAIRSRCADDRRIVLMTEIFSEERMHLLQAACDALISLHRSEGFGLNLAECMAAGKIVIATDFSGNCDFMNATNSIPIPYAPRPLREGEYIEGDGQWWAEPDHAAAVAAIRRVATRAPEIARIAENAKVHIRQNYSYEEVGRIAIEALRGTLAPFKP